MHRLGYIENEYTDGSSDNETTNGENCTYI